MRRTTGFTLLELLVVVAVIAVGVYGGIAVLKRNALAARATAEPWRQSPKWRGTRITANDAPQTVVVAFENDPPAPDGRKATFVNFLSGKKYYCVGWYGSIDAVTPNADGWEATVSIGCHLRGGGVPFSKSMTTETWQIFKSGAAKCVKCNASSVAVVDVVD